MDTRKTAWSRDCGPWAQRLCSPLFCIEQYAASSSGCVCNELNHLAGGCKQPNAKLDVRFPTLKSYTNATDIMLPSLPRSLLANCITQRHFLPFRGNCIQPPQLVLSHSLSNEDSVLHLWWSSIKNLGRAFPLLSYRVFLCWRKNLKLKLKERA